MTETDVNKHVAVVFKDDNDYIVAPGRLVIREGDTVSIYNLTDSDANVEFFDGNPFGEDFTLHSGNWQSAENVVPGVYAYEVIVGSVKAQASRPVIIVYPRP